MIRPFVEMLSCYPKGDLVAEAMHSGMFAPYGAIATTFWIAQNPRELVCEGTYGNPKSVDDFYRRISTQVDLPVAVAFREARIVISDFEELSDSFRLLSDVPRLGPGGYVNAPILLGGRSVGAFAFMRLRANALVDVDMDLINMLSHLLGLWFAASSNETRKSQVQDHATAPLSLTERQTRIVELMGEGWTSDEIAIRLGYSTSTVKQEVVRMKNALNVESRQALVENAKRLSLVP